MLINFNMNVWPQSQWIRGSYCSYGMRQVRSSCFVGGTKAGTKARPFSLLDSRFNFLTISSESVIFVGI